MEGYAIPYRLDRNANGGGTLYYVRDDVPPSFLIFNLSIEGFVAEIKLRKKKLLQCCYCNPKKNFLTKYLNCIGRSLDALG